MHPSLLIILLPKEYVGLKCKWTLEYVLSQRHTFMVACMLVHLFVIQLACSFYDGLFGCNRNDNMTKKDFTIICPYLKTWNWNENFHIPCQLIFILLNKQTFCKLVVHSY
jgi:hypothetical protein